MLRVLAAGRIGPADPDIRRVVDLMRARPGEPVGAYAAAVGLSERQMRRRFTAAVGLAPKPYLRVRRLHAVLAAARHAGRPSWATLAVDAGFFDQPHMFAEFRRSVGCVPGAVLAAEDGRFLHDRRPTGAQGRGHGRQPR
jgi:AraC-like DNA-binding protein